MNVQVPESQQTSRQFAHATAAGSIAGNHSLLGCGMRQIDGQIYHAITDVDRIPPFFMSLVSADDHWMFVASNGALTCGRKCADRALFPYYSADKLLDMVSVTGPTTVVQLALDGRLVNWTPWSDSWPLFEITRSLYKNRLGNRVCFEEANRTLGLVFRYHWGLSRKYGFVRHVEVANTGSQPQQLRILDGLRNVLPAGLDHQFQLRFSNLADAYKKSELQGEGRIGVFYLSSIPTDRAEPREGLRASFVWHDMQEPCQILLSDRQLGKFLRGGQVEEELDVCGQRGSFLTVRNIELERQALVSWNIVADVHQTHCDLALLQQQLAMSGPAMPSLLEGELAEHDQALLRLASQVDGTQLSQDACRADRHLSNSLFNAMRGGFPADGYGIEAGELSGHVRTLNREVWSQHQDWLNGLPTVISSNDLLESARSLEDVDLRRICEEYLPLTFSRRHGDPTRPWNTFNIDLKNLDGSRKLGYEGNWRDIFQNWEALATGYPLYLPAMIKRFVNASTIDGYNPYRITKSGFDWERQDPADPWANIGYWGDHQIVYLLKLLEQSRNYRPTALDEALTIESCVYANVPYRIRDYDAIRQNPRATIDYDSQADEAISLRVAEMGTDGQLVVDRSGRLHRVSLLEKLLLTAAVKMTNWIPDAGIWLNTQRPEWNDAQNALVGYGASVITACHLRRYFKFIQEWLQRMSATEATHSLSGGQVRLSSEVAELLFDLKLYLSTECSLNGKTDDRHRATVVSQLQMIGEAYRKRVYAGVTGQRETVSLAEILIWINQCLDCLESTILRNRRPDALYHSYNLLNFQKDGIGIEHLDEMLEGQVAAIESGLLKPEEVVELLEGLRSSRLYREDQRSYTLYPTRSLARFDERNRVDASAAESIPLVRHLMETEDSRIIYRDAGGCYRFAADFQNANGLRRELDLMQDWRQAGSHRSSESHRNSRLSMGHSNRKRPVLPAAGSVKNSHESKLQALVASDSCRLLQLYEQTFHHRRFTGRANTFFAYEGLGSIYWHMVSKLALAVCRECVQATAKGSVAAERLRMQFRELNDGIWRSKSPSDYGAFPTDPYSHTPLHAGAQQPGMTGQVKEDILTRQLELGVRIELGSVKFDLSLVEEGEFLLVPATMDYFDVHGVPQSIALQPGCLGYTLCQVPIIVRKARSAHARIVLSGERIVDRPSCQLSQEETQWLLSRNGQILKIEIEWVNA